MFDYHLELFPYKIVRDTISKVKDILSRDIVPVLPCSLMIEPTNVCHLSCPTCPTGAGKMNRPKRMMSYQEFKWIVEQVNGHVKNITLWGYGEPFLNNELLDMIRYATSNGMQVITSTNGQFFKSEEFCLQVIKSGLQRLIICLDGADQKTISKFRGDVDFNKILTGIKLLIKAKKMLKSKTPSIELQFILMKQNEHQRTTMRQLAKELEVNIYSEKTVGIDANDPDFQRMCMEFLPKDLSLSRYYVKKDGSFALKGKYSNYCSSVYRYTVINSDGTVIPCCYDLYSEHIMGNVFKEHLSSIWKNDKYQSFRRQIRRDRKSIPICNICSEGLHVSKRETLK